MSNESALQGQVTLWERLAGDATALRSPVHFWVGGRYERTTWAQLVRDAELMTAGLRRAGVRRGSRVAMVLTNSPHTARGLLAVWLCGGVVASVPTRVNGMDEDEYFSQLAKICAHLEPDLFLAEASMVNDLSESLTDQYRVAAFESIAGSGRKHADPPGDDEPALIQYSSGSTSDPKGCMISPRAITKQLDLLAELVAIQPGEVGVSWLPWSHDMGLFGGLLTGWWNDAAAYFSTPDRFLFSPRTWFEDMARFGGRFTVGSPTALHLASRVAARSKRMPGGLGQVRACILGAERVRWDVLRHAIDSLGPHGLREQALMPAYGLAEGTLAVTATPMRDVPRHIALDTVSLADSAVCEVDPDHPFATQVVSAGVPCDGVELVGSSTAELTEIRVRSECLAMGYFADDERTQQQFHDNTLFTGDLGFVRDGYLYPVGRTDDLISVGGRNVYSREIESAVDDIDGVRFGCSTLIGAYERGTLRLTLFIEGKSPKIDHRSIAERAARLAMAKAAVALDQCVFLARNELPKTPSGKIQRHRCLTMFETGRFEPVATVRLGQDRR